MGPIGGLKRVTCGLRVKERSKTDNRVSVCVHGTSVRVRTSTRRIKWRTVSQVIYGKGDKGKTFLFFHQAPMLLRLW